MSQHDFNIANQLFPDVRSDINAALLALASTNSGASLPSTTFPGMIALNTGDSILYARNAANDAWLKLGKFESGNSFTPYFGNAELDLGSMSEQEANAVAITGGTLAGITAFELISTDTGAGAGPELVLRRDSASPAADDLLARLAWYGDDSGGANTLYAALTGKIIDKTDGSEDAEILFSTVNAGTYATRFHVGQGLFAEGQADPGAGKIAASNLYVGTLPVLTDEHVIIECLSDSTLLTVGQVKRIPWPVAWTVTGVKANLTTSQASGSVVKIDIKKNGTSIFNSIVTTLGVDNGEITSVTYSGTIQIDLATWAADDIITIHVAQTAGTTAAGLVVTISGHR